jgi:hypothetical protein
VYVCPISVLGVTFARTTDSAAKYVAHLNTGVMQKVHEDEDNLFSHHLIPH